VAVLLAGLVGVAWADEPRTSPPPAASPSPVGVDDLRAEVERLRRDLDAVRAELQALRAPGAAPSADAARLERLETLVHQLEERLRQTADALEALSSEVYKRLTLSVYGSLEARNYSGDNGFLDGNLVELVLSGRPHKRLSLVTQIEFERAGGAGRGGEIVVEQAWAGLQLTSDVTFRAGIFLVPFGNTNLDHFPFKREVVTPPLINQVAAPGDWSDNGVGLSGRRLFGHTWLLSFDMYAGAGLGDELGAGGLRAARQPYGIDNNRDTALMGRLALARGQRFELGLSGYRGAYDDQGQRGLGAFALDLLLARGPLRFNAEFDSFAADRGTEPGARYRGVYARLVYEFGRAWLPRTFLGRDFEDPRLQLVAQYDLARTEGPDEGGFGRRRERRLTAGLNWRPSSQWVLKATYEINSTDAAPLVRGDRDGFIGSINFVF
jgi:hypothetical protein